MRNNTNKLDYIPVTDRHLSLAPVTDGQPSLAPVTDRHPSLAPVTWVFFFPTFRSNGTLPPPPKKCLFKISNTPWSNLSWDSLLKILLLSCCLWANIKQTLTTGEQMFD